MGIISDLLLLILAPEHLPYNSNTLNTSSIDCLLDTVTVVISMQRIELEGENK
jgi:hypothetical protein